MKNSTLWKYCAFCVLTLGLLLPTSNSTQAQSAKKPPNVLWILQEEIKPGQVETFKALQAELTTLYAKAGFPYTWVGSVEEGEKGAVATFYMELDSLNTMDDLYRAFELAHTVEEQIAPTTAQAEGILVSQTESFASLRPDLSIETAETEAGLFRDGFIQIVKVRVKADKTQHWAKVVAETTSALKKAGAGKGYLTYEIISGDTPGTFLFLYPSNSADEASLARDNEQAAIRALGGDLADRLAKVTSEAVVQEQRSLFSAAPSLTFPSRGKGR